MNFLPVEVLEVVFSFLNYTDKLSCSAVSKKFRFVANSKKPESLFLFEDGLPSDRDLDTYLNSTKQNRVLKCNFNLFFPKLCLNNFYSKVKQFYVYNQAKVHNGEELFLILNKLVDLECLEITSIIEFRNDCTLILPEIKSLSLCLNNFFGRELTLKTNKLEQLKINAMCCVNILYPETIKKLFLQEYNKQINELVNLEYLSCNEFQDFMSIKCFYELDKLQTIDIANSCSAYKTLCFFRDIYQRKVNVFYYGAKFDERELNKYVISTESKKSKYLINSEIHSFNIKSLLESSCIAERLQFIKSIELETVYNNLDKLPKNFLNRLTNVRSIHSSAFSNDSRPLPDHISEKNLLEFLSKFPQLCLLNLQYSDLSDEFYSSLPTMIPHLRDFIFHSDDENQNFEFIFNLKQLKKLVIFGIVPVNFVNSILKKSKKLSEFNFCFHKKSVDNMITIEIENSLIKFMFNEISHEFSDVESLNQMFVNDFYKLTNPDRRFKKMRLN